MALSMKRLDVMLLKIRWRLSKWVGRPLEFKIRSRKLLYAWARPSLETLDSSWWAMEPTLVLQPLLSSSWNKGGWVFSVLTERQPTPVFLPGKIPWMEEPGRLHTIGLQRVGHDWVTSLHFLLTFLYILDHNNTVRYYYLHFVGKETEIQEWFKSSGLQR